MKLEKQCCTLEQARRLMELGIAQDVSLCRFEQFMYQNKYEITDGLWQLVAHRHNNTDAFISAFNVAELGVMLPDLIEITRQYELWCIKERNYPFYGSGTIFSHNDILCKAPPP